MILKTLIVIIGILLLFSALMYARSNKPSRRVHIVEPITQSEHVIGDGACAWSSTPARYPQRSALVRKMNDPRGA
jgi:hypothetical protein